MNRAFHHRHTLPSSILPGIAGVRISRACRTTARASTACAFSRLWNTCNSTATTVKRLTTPATPQQPLWNISQHLQQHSNHCEMSQCDENFFLPNIIRLSASAVKCRWITAAAAKISNYVARKSVKLLSITLYFQSLCSKTRSSADADNGLDAFSGQSRPCRISDGTLT